MSTMALFSSLLPSRFDRRYGFTAALLWRQLYTATFLDLGPGTIIVGVDEEKLPLTPRLCRLCDATSCHPTCHLLFALFKTTTNTITYSIYVDSTWLNYIRFGAELTRGRLHWVTGRVVWEPSSFWDRVDLGPSCPGAELTWGRFGLGTKWLLPQQSWSIIKRNTLHTNFCVSKEATQKINSAIFCNKIAAVYFLRVTFSF